MVYLILTMIGLVLLLVICALEFSDKEFMVGVLLSLFGIIIFVSMFSCNHILGAVYRCKETHTIKLINTDLFGISHYKLVEIEKAEKDIK